MIVKYWERFLAGGFLIPVGIWIIILAINELAIAEEHTEPGWIYFLGIFAFLIGIDILIMGLYFFLSGLIKEVRNKGKS
jgi:putative Mn2+ efflux pump MntP